MSNVIKIKSINDLDSYFKSQTIEIATEILIDFEQSLEKSYECRKIYHTRLNNKNMQTSADAGFNWEKLCKSMMALNKMYLSEIEFAYQ